jgi:2-dehydro-3-deoxyglucarate aldolase/4-hydroxy-2-oxoheptanedioate aldolase
MNTKLEIIRNKFTNKIPVLGTHVFLRDKCISELLGNLNYDFIWIDGEHTGIDRACILDHIIAMNGTNAACFVRMPWNDPVLVKPVLDMGVDGIIFPYIRSAEDARSAVASCEYPPKGIRGFGPLRATKYGLIDANDYIKGASRDVFKIIQIEHIDAINCIDEILKVEGIDMMVCGPNDLSGSMGQLLKTRNEKVMAAFELMAKKCCERNMPFGVSMGSVAENMYDWVKRGVSFLSLDTDTGYILKGAMETYKRAIKVFKEAGR